MPLLYAVLAASNAVSPAAAYFGWYNGCYRYSAQTCHVGNGYHGLVRVYFNQWAASPEVCAKGRTEAGNIRTGSGCNYNANGRDSHWTYATPLSAGYGYWGGSGGPHSFNISEASPSDYGQIPVGYCSECTGSRG